MPEWSSPCSFHRHSVGGEVSSTNHNLDSVDVFPSSNGESFSFEEAKMLFNRNVAPDGISSSSNQNLALSSTGKRACLAFSAFDSTLIYVDSGAGQCLCSCDAAFIQMSPCEIEISGVAGCLQIYGIGTALFAALDENEHEMVIGIHNCLFGQGEFNLISVSQLCEKPANSVDLSLDSPFLHLMSSGQRGRRISIPFPCFWMVVCSRPDLCRSNLMTLGISAYLSVTLPREAISPWQLQAQEVAGNLRL
jgi:hypothetical protein